MPALTRRREKDRAQESWNIYFGDVRIGWIGERAGVPKSVEQWDWCVGFYPRDGHVSGTARTFEHARADFAEAWSTYLPRCTDADFDGYRRQRAWTAWKHAMWQARASASGASMHLSPINSAETMAACPIAPDRNPKSPRNI